MVRVWPVRQQSRKSHPVTLATSVQIPANHCINENSSPLVC
ncbi:hypothetical protein SCOCK_140028 [Actinacidiphila cocklensis]|uniref:Uncharacterized protein n=1 Tax=Actinacidiphila cocklensis TaxID=887465 RepID=A0A9W4GNX5_9ACTN|nr:hypothetical protein SCOCK_140028 [Actinacidiphila cocklensis]